MNLLIQILFCRTSEDILSSLVQTESMDERQKDIVKQGLHRMFNLCENQLLMLNLGKLISMSDLDQEFNKQSNKSSLSSPDKLMFTVKREEKSNRPT